MTGTRTSVPLEVRDDAWHEHGGAPAWTERLAFTFFDTTSGFGGIARLSFDPQAHTADGSVAIFIPEGGFATVLTKAKPERILEAEVGRIGFRQEQAMKRWHMGCKDIALIFTEKTSKERQGAAAPIEMDLTFDAWTPSHGSVAREKGSDELGFVSVISHGHFEQAGRATGRLRLGRRQTTIDGTGVRERSWGTRDATARHAASWYAASFSPSLSFGIRTFSLGDRDTGSGWIWREGQIHALRSVSMDAGDTTHTIELVDDTGRALTVTGDLLATIPLREGASHLTLRLMRFRCGDAETLGLFETVRDD